MKLTFLTLFAASICQATVTLTADFGYALTSNSQPIPVGSLAVLVADGNGDGFTGSSSGSSLLAGKTLSSGTVFGSDDVVLGVLTGYDPGTGTGTLINGYSGTVVFPIDTVVTIGDNLGVYFFPTISSSSTAISPGDTYGFFSQPNGFNAVAGGSIAMKVPADGNTESLAYYTPKFYLDNSVEGGVFDPTQSQLTASLTVPVPEPSTYALMGLGLVVVGLMARRKKV